MPSIKRVTLTRSLIDGAELRSSPYRVWDAKVPGLVLRVLPSGRRTFETHWARGRTVVLGAYPTTTLEAARTRALAVLGEAAKGDVPRAAKPKAERVNVRTFGDFMAHRYGPHVEATAKAGKATVRNIEVQFGHLYDRPLGSIGRADADTFRAARTKAGIKPATINRDLDRLRAALNQAAAWELIDGSPLKGVKRVKRGIESRVRYLTKAEEKALRAALQAREDRAATQRASGNAWRAQRGREALPAIKGYSDHLMPMTLLSLNTGLRRGELTQLTWADIDLQGKRLTVRAGYAKSGKARHVPLNAEALAVLRRLRSTQKGDGRLFPVKSVSKAWDALTAAAGIKGLRWHDLRHDFASKLVMAGVSLSVVRDLLGHSTVAMTERYAHLAPELHRSAVDVLGRRADER